MSQQHPAPPPPPYGQPPRRLVRSRQDRMVAGICGGLAGYLGMDPTLVRVLAVLLLVFTFPAAGIAYLLMWLIVPQG